VYLASVNDFPGEAQQFQIPVAMLKQPPHQAEDQFIQPVAVGDLPAMQIPITYLDHPIFPEPGDGSPKTALGAAKSHVTEIIGNL